MAGPRAIRTDLERAGLAASGFLLAHGFEALMIEYSREREYNRPHDELFTTDDATSLMQLLAASAQ